MSPSSLPIGSTVWIEKSELQAVIKQLKQLDYRVVGPRMASGAIVYDDLDTVDQLPVGYVDEQDGGRYRLVQEGAAWFDYVVGPHSLKNYIFPPRDTLLEMQRANGEWQIRPPQSAASRLAVIGPRSCDLHALRIQDRVFLNGAYVDPAYRSRRESLFIVAVNCRRAAATCFCQSMKTGPAVTMGCDLSLTELENSFVVQVGSELGGTVITAADWSPCPTAQIDEARGLPLRLSRSMSQRHKESDKADDRPRQRYLDTTEIRDLLMENLEHERWHEVGQRCLACANCTMVCPTCFCNSVEDITNLTGDHVRRERIWSSCFSAEHSYMNSGTVRKSIAARYRQWLTHKLATWIDQFGTSGCVGCGRCITWCPVGIDLTEEVAAMRLKESA